MTITEQLEAYAEAKDRLEVLRMTQDELKARILEPVAQALKDLEAEYAPARDAIDDEITALEYGIRAAVLEQRETAKGSRYMAVWNKPRVSWDTKALDGYAIAHPEIAAMRSVGEPSVSIRTVGR